MLVVAALIAWRRIVVGLAAGTMETIIPIVGRRHALTAAIADIPGASTATGMGTGTLI